MASIKACRVCGKEYEACRSASTGAFRWQEVACSPECGEIYFRRVNEARGLLPKKSRAKKQAPVVEIVEVVDATETVEQAEE